LFPSFSLTYILQFNSLLHVFFALIHRFIMSKVRHHDPPLTIRISLDIMLKPKSQTVRILTVDVSNQKTFQVGKRMKKKQEINLLNLIPEKLINHEIDEKGIITLLVPRFKNRFLKKLNERYPERQFNKIKLDEIGSSTWINIDGKRDVRQIGELMKDQFGETIEPCYDRLGMFMTKLEYEKYIRFINLD